MTGYSLCIRLRRQAMTAVGQKCRFDPAPNTSGLAGQTDILSIRPRRAPKADHLPHEWGVLSLGKADRPA